MNNNTNENTQQTNENVVKPVSGGDVPATAEDIVKQAEQEAARIQKKELELQQLDQKLTQELLKEQQDVNQKLHEDLIDVIKHFNKDNRFHMILSTSAMQEQVVYAIDGYDISSEIIEMLNNQELMKEIKEKE